MGEMGVCTWDAFAFLAEGLNIGEMTLLGVGSDNVDVDFLGTGCRCACCHDSWLVLTCNGRRVGVDVPWLDTDEGDRIRALYRAVSSPSVSSAIASSLTCTGEVGRDGVTGSADETTSSALPGASSWASLVDRRSSAIVRLALRFASSSSDSESLSESTCLPGKNRSSSINWTV